MNKKIDSLQVNYRPSPDTLKQEQKLLEELIASNEELAKIHYDEQMSRMGFSRSLTDTFNIIKPLIPASSTTATVLSATAEPKKEAPPREIVSTDSLTAIIPVDYTNRWELLKLFIEKFPPRIRKDIYNLLNTYKFELADEYLQKIFNAKRGYNKNLTARDIEMLGKDFANARQLDLSRKKEEKDDRVPDDDRGLDGSFMMDDEPDGAGAPNFGEGIRTKDPYKIKGGYFGDIKIDTNKLRKGHLYGTKGGKVVINSQADLDTFDLLNKKFNSNRDYSNLAIKNLKKLIANSGTLKNTSKSRLTNQGVKYKNNNQCQTIQPLYYNDPQELVDKLLLLRAEKQSGNNSKLLTNEALAILGVLFKKAIFNARQYKTMVDNFLS